MKKLIVSSLILSMITIACNQQKQSDGQTTSMEASEAEIIKAPSSELSAEQLKDILTSYFSVKNALVKSDSKEVKTALVSLLQSVGSEFESISTLGKEMQAKEDVEEIRSGFERLSQEIYRLVQANNEVKDQVVYKQFCPMAFNNQGAFWLSSEKEIRNPYFGDKMLRCGKIQEEL